MEDIRKTFRKLVTPTKTRRLRPSAAASIVLGTLANPCADRGAVAGRELLFAVRHARLQRAAPVEQPHQVAAVRVLRDHHRAKFCALHHALPSRQVEAALLKPFETGRVTADTAALENWKHILGEGRLLCGRAGLINRGK